jgi:hypothetical protein
MKKKCKCPLCEEQYHKRNKKTRHHVFPKMWYHGLGPQVDVCESCHKKFNSIYTMNRDDKWEKECCLQNWSDFCKSKGKWMYKVYPQLKKEGLAHL